MRSAFPAALLCLLAFANLHAYEAVVRGPHLWPDAEPVDRLIELRKRDLRLTKDVRALRDPGYAIHLGDVDTQGRFLRKLEAGSNPAFTAALRSFMQGVRDSPLQRGGKAVEVRAWISLVVNPETLDPARPEARARLIDVAPVSAPTSLLPLADGDHRLVWTQVAIAADGTHALHALESAADEPLRATIEAAFPRWKFAPARSGGRSVPSVLRTPVLVTRSDLREEGITPPVVLQRVGPIYPPAVRDSGLRGELLVSFFVDEEGVVRDPVIVRSSNPGLDGAVLAAILKWRYEPALRDGVPLRVPMTQAFRFEVDTPEGGGREAYKTTKTDLSALPPELRYDIAPRPRLMPVPVYPHALYESRARGSARLMIALDDRGRVTATRVLSASHPEFGAALVAAAEMSEFEPARREGNPTATVIGREEKFTPDGGPERGADAALFRLERDKPSTIVDAEALDAALEPLSRRPPVYPIAQRKAGISGRATVDCLIDETGAVRLPRVASATDPAFGYAAVQCVQLWVFAPPLVGGKPVVTRVRVPITFTASDE